jgi:hypothetical protein
MMQMVGPSGHLFDWGDGHAGTPETGAIFTIADYYNISQYWGRRGRGESWYILSGMAGGVGGAFASRPGGEERER